MLIMLKLNYFIARVHELNQFRRFIVYFLDLKLLKLSFDTRMKANRVMTVVMVLLRVCYEKILVELFI